jgi:hypothetical protein
MFFALGLPSAYAGASRELAEAIGRTDAPVQATRTVDDEVFRLFGGGNVPRVSRLDAKYNGRRGSKQCRKTWQTLRQKAVSRRPAAATDAIIAKAVAAGVSKRHIEKTLATYLANRDDIPNQRYISVIDFNKRSNQKRLFTIDLASGDVKSYDVAAGKGSDRDGDGYATYFSNKGNSHASSLGCSLAAGFYNGSHGNTLMLHGFEATNDNSCERSVVMHSASYVGGVPGRSWGCPAVKRSDREEIFDKIGGGGLICAYKDGEVHEAERAPAVSKKKKKSKSKKRSKKHVRRRRR